MYNLPLAKIQISTTDQEPDLRLNAQVFKAVDGRHGVLGLV
jgi:hypothetical protein